ncbi:hypothetical protein [Hyalangium sp.]|uniref:hypothetical protein n=1 Tax=Hyalangium sp. TaxID=2028555 RepID=UPI002D5D4397|nr:hypothetical protein [Hyalangium sp.]HYI02130.1 hypothetical protein [Hyalangium sp.]
MRDAKRRHSGSKELEGLELFLWRRTDWRGQRWLEDVFINGSPVALTRMSTALRRMLTEHPPRGTCRFRARPATRADVARIFHETDHRTKKSTKKPPYEGLDVEEALRKAGARMEWLSTLTVQWSAETPGATLRLHGREVLLEAGTEAVQELADACEGQAGGWGNEGCFGSHLSSGLTFAPDWLGIE